MALVIYFAFCVLVGIIATSLERNPIGWFLAAAIISPLLALIILLAVHTISKHHEEAPRDEPR